MADAAPSPLAPVVVDLVRDLRTTRLLAACQRDYLHWLTELHVRSRLRHYREPLDLHSSEGRAALQRERVNLVAEWREFLDRRDRKPAATLKTRSAA